MSKLQIKLTMFITTLLILVGFVIYNLAIITKNIKADNDRLQNLVYMQKDYIDILEKEITYIRGKALSYNDRLTQCLSKTCPAIEGTPTDIMWSTKYIYMHDNITNPNRLSVMLGANRSIPDGGLMYLRDNGIYSLGLYGTFNGCAGFSFGGNY